MKYIAFISLLILPLIIASPSPADVYKYVDENGVIHFTNIPKGEGYKKIISEKRRRAKKNYDQIIQRKSSKYDLEPSIVKAVITTESNWNPKAVSHKGALGLMQLMPSTAEAMQINNPLDPEQNIEAGTRYLRHLLDRFNGDLDLALAAYNAGPSKVEKSGGMPSISETRSFVKNVKSLFKGKAGKRKRPTRIYKVTYPDGTILYTNTPLSDENIELSNF
jgi:soluble lytic murein transglycosylase